MKRRRKNISSIRERGNLYNLEVHQSREKKINLYFHSQYPNLNVQYFYLNILNRNIFLHKSHCKKHIRNIRDIINIRGLEFLEDNKFCLSQYILIHVKFLHNYAERNSKNIRFYPRNELTLLSKLIYRATYNTEFSSGGWKNVKTKSWNHE